MHEPESSVARRIARAARDFEHQTTGRLPDSITVVPSEDTLVITLRGTYSPVEIALAKSQKGAAKVRELHQQLFSTASAPLRREIEHIAGTDVRDATVEVETSTGTVVQVFTLAQTVPADTWRGSEPGPAQAKGE